MKAIILGAGYERVLEGASKEEAETAYGNAVYYMKDGILLLPRHGVKRELAPLAINYRANIQLLSDLSVEEVITIYSASSVSNRFYPGSYAMVKDFIDFTWGRENSFHDGVGKPFQKTPMVRPFDKGIGIRFAKAAGGNLPFRGVYLCINGPRGESKAEVRAYRNLGADMIGMTLATEAELLVEAKIPNCAIAMCTGWAAGLDEEGHSYLEDESFDRLSLRVFESAFRSLC